MTNNFLFYIQVLSQNMFLSLHLIVENTSGRMSVLGKMVIDFCGVGHIEARAGALKSRLQKMLFGTH